jgi:hypothetical protein
VLSDVLRIESQPPAEQAAEAAPTAAPAVDAPPTIASVGAPAAEPEPEVVPESEPEAPAAESAAAAPPSDEPAVSEALQARVEELTAGWGRMQAELAELRQRVAVIEQRGPEPPDEPDAAAQGNRPATPAEERDALLRAGVAPELADDLIWRRSQLSLARLELYDEASRNDWLGTARYREELRRINEQRVSIEDEIGVDAYDRYLYQTGQPNRVAVDSVLPGSVGEESGLLPGDIIEGYDKTPILDFDDLRTATSAGERNELVPVSVVRGGQRLELWLPRGPIGIGLDATRLDPSG